MNFNIETRTSKKGNKYQCLVITCGDWERVIFLTTFEAKYLSSMLQ